MLNIELQFDITFWWIDILLLCISDDDVTGVVILKLHMHVNNSKAFLQEQYFISRFNYQGYNLPLWSCKFFFQWKDKNNNKHLMHTSTPSRFSYWIRSVKGFFTVMYNFEFNQTCYCKLIFFIIILNNFLHDHAFSMFLPKI